MTKNEQDPSQLEKYAEDLQKVYRSEKNKRVELEVAYTQLKKFAKDLNKALAELKKSNKKLKRQVELEEREKLVERKLIHANRMESLGTMASGIAHEINNPVSFLLGNTQMLIEIWRDAEKLLSKTRRLNKDIILGGLKLEEVLENVPGMLQANFQGTDRIMNIISGLTDYSALHGDGKTKHIDINKVIDFSLMMLAEKINKSGVRLVKTLQEGLPDPPGRPEQIEQVIINVIRNSLNAVKKDEGTILIGSMYKKKSGYVKITIRDDGEGIKKEDLSRVTEPFFTRSRDRGGTGLGLYITYSIVTGHGGTLEIDSEPGRGTEVTISLPVDRRTKNG